MGALGAGFSGFTKGLTSVVQPALEKKRAQKYANDQQVGAEWMRILSTKDLPDAIREQGEKELQRIYGVDKQSKTAIQKFGDILKKVTGKQAGAQRQQRPNQLQPPAQNGSGQQTSSPQQSTAAPQPQGSPFAKLQPPQPSQPVTMANALQASATAQQANTPEALRIKQLQEDRQRRTEEAAKHPELTGKDQLEFIETGKFPTTPAAGSRKAERWKVGDKELDVDFDPKTGTRYFEGKEWEIPEGATRVAATPSGVPRFGSQLVTLDDAKRLQKESGTKFQDPDGDPLDLDKLPKNMMLQPVTINNKLTYLPIDPKYQKYTIGNVSYATTPQQLPQLAQGGGTTLGVQNVGSTGTHEVAAVDANGNPIAQGLTTSRKPNVGGVAGAPQSSTPPTPATASKGSQPAAQNAPAPKQIGSVPKTAAGNVAANSRPLPGMQAGTYNRMLDRITSVREAATQIFGDPSQPTMKSMKDFAPLADDPGSRDRLGKTLNLTFNQMQQATHGAGVSGTAGPVSVSTGGVGDVLEKYFGVPAKDAQLTNKIMQDAIQSLTPQEREAYDATMATFSTIVGLRSLTKASAAQASVNAIEREIPTIGLFTADSAQYLDRLQHLAEVVYNGSKGVPKGMWDQNPGLYEYIQKLPSTVKAAPKSSPNKLTPPASSTSRSAPKTADEYLHSVGVQ